VDILAVGQDLGAVIEGRTLPVGVKTATGGYGMLAR
jgi:hypothetical protein